MTVTLQYFDGCPHWHLTDERLRALSHELDFQISYQEIAPGDDVAELHFIGSPTILMDGRDPFARGDEPTGMACRIYPTPTGPAGSPTIEQLRAKLS